MKLTVGEAAQLLAAPEGRVYQWIEEADLPAQKIRGQYRINRSDLLEWATERDIGVSPRAFRRERATPSLAEALRAGGRHHVIDAEDLPAVIRRMVEQLPLASDDDRETLLQILLAREALGVTPVGDGIAIPHVRTPIILAPSEAVLALSFLTAPLDLKAPDGRPVDTLFLLICPTIHVHLAMLSKLAFGLKNAAFREAVRRRAPSEEIVAIAESLEEDF